MTPIQIAFGPAVDTVLQALGSAIVASLTFWLAKRRGTDEPFRPAKAVPVVVGAFVVALVLIATGQATSRNDLVAALPVFAGPVIAWLQEAIQRYKSREYGSTAQ